MSVVLLVMALTGVASTPICAQHYAYHHPLWADIDTAIKKKSQRTYPDNRTDLEQVCDYNLLLQKYLHDSSGIDVDITRIVPDSFYINYKWEGKSICINQSSYDCRGKDDFLLFTYRLRYSNHLKKIYTHFDQFYAETAWCISQAAPDSILIFQFYNDAKENGRHVEFYPDGQIAVDGQYRADSIGLIKTDVAGINALTLEEYIHNSAGSRSKKSGTWIYYDRSGNVIRREEY